MSNQERVAWLSKHLEDFIVASEGEYCGDENDWDYHYELKGDEDRIISLLPIVERIFDRYLPGWNDAPTSYVGPVVETWGEYRSLAIRALTLVRQEEEIERFLGDAQPTLSSKSLHPWVWDGARSLWGSHHYREGLEAALKKVNAETQNKVHRRDVSEAKLFQESFSTDEPKKGRPRLRLMEPDGSETYESRHRGAMALAEGLYKGLRNPLAHEVEDDLDEQVALEYLAAISVLARWVDEARVDSVG